MPSPGPPGQPYHVIAMSPITPSTHPFYVDSGEVVDAAQRSGRFPADHRDYWLGRVRAGGRAGASSIMAMLELPDDEQVWAAMYPEPAPAPPAEPDRGRMASERLGWLVHNASVGPGAPGDDGDPADPGGGDYAVIDHERITVKSHDHMHSSYLGGVHKHAHAHLDNASHAPDGVNHVHQVAASNPVTAGIQARAAATAAADLTPDQIYERLYGPG